MSSLSLLAILIVLVAVFFGLRLRASINARVDDLRLLTERLVIERTRLEAARTGSAAAARATARDAAALADLRTRLSVAERATAAIQKARDDLMVELEKAEARAASLTARLAAADARAAALQRDVEAAELVRWELLAKLAAQADQRMSAMAHLRRPTRPMADARSSTDHPVEMTGREDKDESAEDALLQIQPDLTASDDDDDDDDELAKRSVRVGERFMDDGAAARHEAPDPLALMRAPWLDGLRPGGAAASISAVLQDGEAAAGVIDSRIFAQDEHGGMDSTSG